MKLVIKKNITLEDVIKAKPKTIYYAVKTTWWTHDLNDLRTFPASGVPCDPRGSVLLQSDKVDEFLNVEAIKNHPKYKHGIDTLMACHSQNCFLEDGRNWSVESFDVINKYLDGEEITSD